MTASDPVHAIASGIVPTEPTAVVAAVASVVLVAVVAFMVYLAVAPMISDSWAEDAAVHGHRTESTGSD